MRLRPSFVVIGGVATLGCNPPAPIAKDPGAEVSELPGNPPMPTSAPSATAPPRKRLVNPTKRAHVEAKVTSGLVSLQPKDGKGRVIYTLGDSCYVRLPFITKEIPPPGTEPPHEVVDCPPSLDDVAFDACMGGTLFRSDKGNCVCGFMGNPPPPPYESVCPK